MVNMAKSTRIVCDAKCILNFDGFDSHGVIENISLSGALIKLDHKNQNRVLHPGDRCDMMLCNNPDLYPVKYTCKVTRVESEIIGIQFLELNIM